MLKENQGKKTTPGNDQISYCMIKNLNDKTKDILLQLYKVWEVGYNCKQR